jgi:outer membrane protein OmpA-like peptidoglycan-associated protein
MKINKKAILILSVFSLKSYSNVCGTDYQAFNPTTNGLDFVTVHSSETLRPCVINMGLFFNYAVNTLTYSEGLASATGKNKPGDKITAADFGGGIGITKNWDFGINVPMVLKQTIDNDALTSSYDQVGITEVKANTKYRFYGDSNGGVAGIFSINQNLIKDNPFAGSNAGPTLNFELAADTTFDKFAIAGNIGYRKRNPGATVAYTNNTGANQTPFTPLRDQFIYSAAVSYLFTSIDTKLIFEYYGSRAVQAVDQNSIKSMNTGELLLGAKHDLNNNIALHGGFAAKAFDSIGSPDWRFYTGVNWAIGPICNETQSQPIVAVTEEEQQAELEVASAPEMPDSTLETEPISVAAPTLSAAKPEVFRLGVEILFDPDKANINPRAVKEIERFMKFINRKPLNKLIVEGHTDSVGSTEYNQALSEKRAKEVRAVIVKNGWVEDSKAEAQGFGESKPIADNGNYQGRQNNRRVELKVYR